MSSHKNDKANVSVVDKLRGYLIDEIEKLRDGSTTAQTANAVTNAAGKYFSSIKLELEVCRMSGRQPRPDIIGIVDANALPDASANASVKL